MSSRYANTTQDMKSVSQPMRGRHCPGLTNQDSDLVSGISFWIRAEQSPCGDTDPESRWSELCNYAQLPSQSESSVWGHWPIRAEHQEPAFRDQYTEPPTASVLGGVYLKSASVRKWKDTDILIKIKTRFCFSPPLLWLGLSVSVLRCQHVGHTFPLTPRDQ